MARPSIGAEGQHGIGLHVGDDRRHLGRALGVLDGLARSVHVVEPIVLGHAEDGEAGLHLLRPKSAHVRGRPPVLIPRTGFAARCDYHRRPAVPSRQGQETRAEVGLVVGMPTWRERSRGNPWLQLSKTNPRRPQSPGARWETCRVMTGNVPHNRSAR
jgi:hypothetical protein